MKIEAVDIRVGNLLKHDNKLWCVNKTMHTQPGKGGAYMQVEMKDIINGTKQNIRFRSSETVEKIRLEQREYQYLYMESDSVVMMDNNTFEQISLNSDIVVDEQKALLEEGMVVEIEFYEEKPISLRLPETLVVKIQDCEPALKGQTVTSSYKPATIKGGIRVMVPPFVNSGDSIIIKTDTMEYIERAK